MTNSIITTELQATRKMTKAFKKTEEESNKLMQELRLKYEMAKDEAEAQKQNFEKRLNTLIRDFVNVYKKLAAEFTSYKTLSGKEYELNQFIMSKKDAHIDE